MRRVMPELRFIQIDGTHPIFDAFYRIPQPQALSSYGEYAPSFWAIFEENDPARRMIALANRDNDLSEFWEFSGEGYFPVDLGALAVGAPVNLERALLPTTRLGGHLVAGHVDGIGHVEKTWDDGRSQRWRFSAPIGLLRYIANKGSICVDGVSLTVNLADDTGFEVNLVPHTIEHTAFASTPAGSPVNLEVDLIARYVERLNTGPRP